MTEQTLSFLINELGLTSRFYPASLLKHDKPKGGNMFESVELDEADEFKDGDEVEEVDPVDESAEKEKAKDPDTTANPSELRSGPGGESPGVHSGTPASK